MLWLGPALRGQAAPSSALSTTCSPRVMAVLSVRCNDPLEGGNRGWGTQWEWGARVCLRALTRRPCSDATPYGGHQREAGAMLEVTSVIVGILTLALLLILVDSSA